VSEETLAAALDRQRQTSSEKRPPEVNAVISGTIDGLAQAGTADRALHVGDRAPDFALPDVRGREVWLGDLLARGSVVLAFYRGVW
jgi:hypothetical protein